MSSVSPSAFRNTPSLLWVSVVVLVMCNGRVCGHVCTSYSLHIGEKQLREQECDKTPDCKLEIPISEFTGVKQ